MTKQQQNGSKGKSREGQILLDNSNHSELALDNEGFVKLFPHLSESHHFLKSGRLVLEYLGLLPNLSQLPVLLLLGEALPQLQEGVFPHLTGGFTLQKLQLGLDQIFPAGGAPLPFGFGVLKVDELGEGGIFEGARPRNHKLGPGLVGWLSIGGGPGTIGLAGPLAHFKIENLFFHSNS